MDQLRANSLPENLEQINQIFPGSRVLASEGFPSLVNIRQSGTKEDRKRGSWSKRQKRTFNRLMSWCTYLRGQGYQLFRVDLTTSMEGRYLNLRGDFKRLRRAFEKKFCRYRVQYFRIQTAEGNGVLHMVWAIKVENPALVPQSWLSDKWSKIHNSPIVYVRRLGGGKRDVKKVSVYLGAQYLAGQDVSANVSWSWWRGGLRVGKAWTDFRKWRDKFGDRGLWSENLEMSYGEMLEGWSVLLTTGEWSWKGAKIFVSGGSVDVEFADGLKSATHDTILDRRVTAYWKEQRRIGGHAYLRDDEGRKWLEDHGEGDVYSKCR